MVWPLTVRVLRVFALSLPTVIGMGCRPFMSGLDDVCPASDRYSRADQEVGNCFVYYCTQIDCLFIFCQPISRNLELLAARSAPRFVQSKSTAPRRERSDDA